MLDEWLGVNAYSSNITSKSRAARPDIHSSSWIVLYCTTRLSFTPSSTSFGTPSRYTISPTSAVSKYAFLSSGTAPPPTAVVKMVLQDQDRVHHRCREHAAPSSYAGGPSVGSEYAAEGSAWCPSERSRDQGPWCGSHGAPAPVAIAREHSSRGGDTVSVRVVRPVC
ncbi:hypothetical protein BJV78DRAFT_1246720 [Lactifluus subvellereus]|nr:hypothetical protein BJV78DRAFT_1246720 [Lactifluus subvellereus]